MTPTNMNQIIKAERMAVEKHPFFAQNPEHAVCLATEELGEMAKAINDGNYEQAIDEVLDTIAVLVRLKEMLEEK